MFNPIMVTAVILAGGLGTRLRMVVSDRPKVIAVINGRPFITYLLDQVENAGLQKVVLCTGYMAEVVAKEIGETYKTLRIIYSEEVEPLGTAGALKLAEPYLNSEYILVLNGDSYVEVDLNKFFKWNFTMGCTASIVLSQVDDVSRYGQVLVVEDDQVISFEEKGEESGPGWINAGIYLLKRVLISTISPNINISLERDIVPLWISQGLHGYRCRGRFLDIGTPEAYNMAHHFFR